MNIIKFTESGKIEFIVKIELLDRIENTLIAAGRATINVGRTIGATVTLPHQLLWFFINRNDYIMNMTDYIKIHFQNK